MSYLAYFVPASFTKLKNNLLEEVDALSRDPTEACGCVETNLLLDHTQYYLGGNLGSSMIASSPAGRQLRVELRPSSKSSQLASLASPPGSAHESPRPDERFISGRAVNPWVA